MRKLSLILLSVLLFLLFGCASDAQDEVIPDDSVVEQEVVPVVSVLAEEDIASAEAFGKAYMEAWKAEDWCISLAVLDSVYNPELTAFYATNYLNFRSEWTREYMAENFIVVTVQYECELDHNLIFYPDGKCCINMFIVRENADAPWEYWDSEGIHEMT